MNENEPPTEVPLDTGDIPKGGGGRLPHPTVDCVLVIRHIVPLRGLGGLGNAGGPVSNGDETGESVVETHLLPKGLGLGHDHATWNAMDGTTIKGPIRACQDVRTGTK